jgi:hypothetical protein
MLDFGHSGIDPLQTRQLHKGALATPMCKSPLDSRVSDNRGLSAIGVCFLTEVKEALTSFAPADPLLKVYSSYALTFVFITKTFLPSLR